MLHDAHGGSRALAHREVTDRLPRLAAERVMETDKPLPRQRAARAGGELFRAALAATLLGGCAGGTAPVNLGGFSPAFKQGYTDDCESAGVLSQRRDEARYKTESEYMQGWNDGYSVCSRR